MRTSIFAGKGGVGKTTSAVSTAINLSQAGNHTLLIDYDGGHSVASTLGIKDDIAPNTIHDVAPNFSIAIIENVDFTSVAQIKGQGLGIQQYFDQFTDDSGIIPLSDMVTTFFGVPTDIATLQKFTSLVKIMCQAEESGYKNVIIDVEPTAGLERLLLTAKHLIQSLHNLSTKGKLALFAIGSKWPDIRAYLGSAYIRGARTYGERLGRTVKHIIEARYFLVCTPEQSPVAQTFEVKSIIERFGGTVMGYVVNNLRGEAYEEQNLAALAGTGLPMARILRQQELHSGLKEHRQAILANIGEQIVRQHNLVAAKEQLEA